ncbi:hypothetical protein BDV29DRAFT_177506 [Aspergillus leporis]|jgi:hypothetical protein|uniref:Uncharacterized protein n=1 Tax=Aspergillus leporis TaxID=41062 RepID=A0A5N5WV58_9EURO|nr:hypothetical protein BDV29DRAFT_177506 [Aspergillus leporis]
MQLVILGRQRDPWYLCDQHIWPTIANHGLLGELIELRYDRGNDGGGCLVVATRLSITRSSSIRVSLGQFMGVLFLYIYPFFVGLMDLVRHG